MTAKRPLTGTPVIASGADRPLQSHTRHHAGTRRRAKTTAQAPELVQQLGAPRPVAGHMGVALWANALAGDGGQSERVNTLIRSLLRPPSKSCWWDALGEGVCGLVTRY